MRHLLIVAAQEPHGMLVAVACQIVPADGVLASVDEGLPGCGAQKLQEGQLDHRHWISINVNVGELRRWRESGVRNTQLNQR